MNIVTHDDLQQHKCYELVNLYKEYAGANTLPAGSYLGVFLHKNYGPVMGGDRDVYYIFETTNADGNKCLLMLNDCWLTVNKNSFRAIEF